MHTFKRTLSILLSLILICGAFTALPVSAEETASISYIDENGDTQSTDTYTAVTSGTTSMTNGFYAVTENVEIADRIEISGTVNLILCDGKTLTSNGGIHAAGDNVLNIYGQAEGTGALTANTSEDYKAGIGGDMEETCGTVTINGGNVTVTGGDDGAAIGGGFRGSGGTVTVNGGTVTAAGKLYGAGIGGGFFGSGGKIIAKCYKDACAVGNGKTDKKNSVSSLSLEWTSEDDYIEATNFGAKSITLKSPFRYTQDGIDMDPVTADNLKKRKTSIF